MPLSPELLQKAVSAGITTGAPLQQPNRPFPSGSNGINLGTPTYIQTAEPALDVNGNLSLLMQGAVGNYLNLVLGQDGSSILGHGNMISGNSSQNVTVSGIVEKGKLSLTIEPYGGSEIYKLELQPDRNTLTGSYNVQSTDGATHSGMAIGILSNNSIKVQSSSNQPQQDSVKAITPTRPLSVNPARTIPIQIGQGSSLGSTFSSSKSISMRTSSG